MTLDPMPLEPELAQHPLVRAAVGLADGLLAPAAAEVDRDGVPLSHLRAVADAGLLGVAAPTAVGGGGAGPAVVRAVTETLSGACGNTWFVTVQHGTPLRLAQQAQSPWVRDDLLPRLATGATLGGVAFSHLRRPGPPQVTATPDGDGWRFDGSVAWFTSWGLADVFVLAGVTPDEQVLFAYVDAVEQPGLTTTGPLPLAAMGGTGTTGLTLDGLHVAADRLAVQVPRDRWLAEDTAHVLHSIAGPLGLLRSILRRLDALGRRRRDDAAVALAARLSQEGAALRAEAYRVLDEVPAGEQMEHRVRLRAQAPELAVRAATALVAAGAGASMALSDPAQRWAREALFHLVQAQTGPVRREQLRRLDAATGGSPGGAAATGGTPPG